MAQKITFSLSANIVSNATSGILLGDFNNWNEAEGIALKKQKDGSLNATVLLDAGKTYQYRYLLNDGRWVNDSNADNYTYAHEFFIDNCVITVPYEDEKPVETSKQVAPVAVKNVIADVIATTKKTSKPKKAIVANTVAPIVVEKKAAKAMLKKEEVAVAEVEAPVKAKKAKK